MTLKLYGITQSTCTRRVITVLNEKNVDYELIPVNFATLEHKQPPYLAKQPFGKVPVLDDDGFLVYESRAIAKYIAKKYAGQGTKLIPEEKDLKSYALFEQVSLPTPECQLIDVYRFVGKACSIEVSYFDSPTSTIAFEKVFKP